MAEEKTVVTAVTKPVKQKTANLEKEAVKKETVKKEAVKKAPAKKATTTKPAAKKPATKKVTAPVQKDELHIQISGKSYTLEDLRKIAKDVWVYDMQKKASAFKSIVLYVKPEEKKVYFVVNGTESGSFLI